MRTALLGLGLVLVALASGCGTVGSPRIGLMHAAAQPHEQQAAQAVSVAEAPQAAGTGNIIREDPWAAAAGSKRASQKAKQSQRSAAGRTAQPKSAPARVHAPDEATMAESQEVARQARDEVAASLH